MRQIIIFFVLIILSSCSENADLIVYNANIYTADQNFSQTKSFAVKDGKFIYVGDESALKNYSSSNIINAQGLTIFPGIIDSHAHFYNLGYLSNQINLLGTKSFDEVIDRTLEFANNSQNDILIGRGWDQNDWNNKTFPSNDLLNKNFPDIPVILRRIDGHAYLVNDFVLKMAGINLSTYVEGGEILKRNGKLTGVLIDNAMRLIDDIIPDPTLDESIKALLKAQELSFENGLTTISEAGISKEQINLIDSLQITGVLKIRIYAMVDNSPGSLDYYLSNGPYKTDRLNVRSFKIYADGALGSRVELH